MTASPLFIGGLPAQGSPLNSADVRNNFLALNARTDKLTVTATVPASTSIGIGSGTVFFGDRVEIDFTGQLLALGDATTGVLPFSPQNIGFFKDIVIVLRMDFNSTTSRYEASAVFVEGPQKASSTSEPDLVQIRSTDIPIAAFVVRHNGIVNNFRGQIDPINQSDIQDIRNFIDAGGLTYFSATVGDRQVQYDGYGTIVLDGYGVPVITGSTVGGYVGLLNDGYGGFIHPIQQAINDVSVSGGGTVFIRRGNYTPIATIIVPSNVELRGEGASTVLQRLDTFQGPMLRVTGSNARIVDMTIVGPTTHVLAFGPLVEFNGADHSTIRNCSINTNGVTGISFKSVATRCMANSNYIIQADTGVFISSDSSKILVTNNQFESCHTDVQDSSTGSLVQNNIPS